MWDICDHRKQQAVNERQRVMTERWLEDKAGLLSNYYFMLLQAELSRFYETVLLQRDYYHAMEGDLHLCFTFCSHSVTHSNPVWDGRMVGQMS